MKLLISPPVDATRLSHIRDAAGEMQVVNAPDEETASREIKNADAFFGKITLELLLASKNLQWVQSPTASLEHYLFPELVEHSCKLSNMRGLFSDVIADHVLGFVLCFARNLHRYIRLQRQSQWKPIGGETERTTFVTGPAQVSGIDRNHVGNQEC